MQDENAAILGLKREYGAVIIGAGNIGRALMCCSCEKFWNTGVFDAQAKAIGELVGRVQALEAFARENRNHLRAQRSALEMASMFYRLGIWGVCNFAPTDAEESRGVRLEKSAFKR